MARELRGRKLLQMGARQGFNVSLTPVAQPAHLTFCLLQSVQQNGSIYIHVYFTKSGFHPDPRQKALYRRLATVHMSRSKSLPCSQDPLSRGPASWEPPG